MALKMLRSIPSLGILTFPEYFSIAVTILFIIETEIFFYLSYYQSPNSGV